MLVEIKTKRIIWLRNKGKKTALQLTQIINVFKKEEKILFPLFLLLFIFSSFKRYFFDITLMVLVSRYLIIFHYYFFRYLDLDLLFYFYMIKTFLLYNLIVLFCCELYVSKDFYVYIIREVFRNDCADFNNKRNVLRFLIEGLLIWIVEWLNKRWMKPKSFALKLKNSNTDFGTAKIAEFHNALPLFNDQLKCHNSCNLHPFYPGLCT